MGEWWGVKCGGYLTTNRELEVHLGERWCYYWVEHSKRTLHKRTEGTSSWWVRVDFQFSHVEAVCASVDWRLSLQRRWFSYMQNPHLYGPMCSC